MKKLECYIDSSPEAARGVGKVCKKKKKESTILQKKDIPNLKVIQFQSLLDPFAA